MSQNIFEYSTKSESLLGGVVDATDPTFETPLWLKTRKGRQIIIFQARSLIKTYGVVVGWAMSKPRKAPNREMMIIKVRPLNTQEKKRYLPRFKKSLSGVIHFW